MEFVARDEMLQQRKVMIKLMEKIMGFFPVTDLTSMQAPFPEEFPWGSFVVIHFQQVVNSMGVPCL